MAPKLEGLEWASVKILSENHTFDFYFHSKRRNRLKASRAAALVNAFSNIRRGSESEHSFDEPDSGSDSDSSV